MKRSGTADLPLHGGHVPQWLAARMSTLGREIISAMVLEFGPSEVLTRMSDPFWFQAFGSVLGMDWHSSGITTSVMGALKRAINPVSNDIGIYICGGRGNHSRKTPLELEEYSFRKGLNGDTLVRASRLSAKVDNTCIQDGFSLYLHSFLVTDTGEWAVVQQGMNPETKMARRYHWHSPAVRSFVSDPHAAIIGKNMGNLLNLSDSRAKKARGGIIEFLQQHPDKQQHELRKLTMPRSHQIRSRDVNNKRLGAIMALAYEKQFASFPEVLLINGVGPRTLQSLALVSEIIYGAPCRFEDPARFSFAHGGKDGAPFPVPLTVYDKSISTLKRAVEKAKIGRTDKLKGLRTLSDLSRHIENHFDPRADLQKVIDHEWNISPQYGGRTVHGPVQPQIEKPEAIQLSLFPPDSKVKE
jgi:uncharacterized protein